MTLKVHTLFLYNFPCALCFIKSRELDLVTTVMFGIGYVKLTVCGKLDPWLCVFNMSVMGYQRGLGSGVNFPGPRTFKDQRSVSCTLRESWVSRLDA